MTARPLNMVIRHLSADSGPDGVGLTDGELLARFLRRDDKAVAALVRRHAPMVWGVCCRLLQNHADAEDAFQATFLVLVRKAADVPRQAVANWLYGVARQTAIRSRATAAKRGRREAQVVNMPEPAIKGQESGVRCQELNDLQSVVDEELSRLPDHYRGVVVLCDLEGMTRKEAARQLGIPEGSVASRLARARVMLAKRLTRRGVVHSGGSVAAVLAAGSASASAPPALVASTIKAASLLAAGQAAGVVSAYVAALTEGMVTTMFVTKIKSALAVVLVVGLVLGGIGAGVGLATNAAAVAQEKTPDKAPAKEELLAPPVAAKKDEKPLHFVEKLDMKPQFDYGPDKVEGELTKENLLVASKAFIADIRLPGKIRFRELIDPRYLKKHGLTDRDIAYETSDDQGLEGMEVADDLRTVVCRVDSKGGGKELVVLQWVVYEGHLYLSPAKAPDPKTGIFKLWIQRTNLASAAGLLHPAQAADRPKGGGSPFAKKDQSDEKGRPLTKEEPAPDNAKQERKVLTPEEAIKQMPKGKVTVQFKVAKVEAMPNPGSGFGGPTYYIYLHDGGRFTARLARAADQFMKLGKDPVKHFGGEVVRVTGQIEPDYGLPSFQMWVSDLADIEVVKEAKNQPPAQPKQEPAKSDRERMVGNWYISNDDSQRKGEMWVITEDSILMHAKDGGANNVHYSHRLDAGKNPKQIDITQMVVNGPVPFVVIKGIYELDGDDLRLCLGAIGKDRPAAFPEKPRPGEVLILQRAASGATPPKAKVEQPAKTDQERMIGDWVIVKNDGKRNRKGEAWSIRRDEISMNANLRGFKVLWHYHRLDPTKDPKQIDITVKMSNGEHVGFIKGIYAFTDDTELRLCLGEMGKDRPTAFAGKPGESEVLILQRQKPGAEQPKSRAEPPAKTDQERMVGNWFIMNDDSIRKGERWVITENDIQMHAKDAGLVTQRYAHRLNALKDPKRIDITVLLLAGQPGLIRGIYSLEGDELRLCLGGLDNDRPVAFPEKPKPGEVLILYRQTPDGGKPKAKEKQLEQKPLAQ